MSIDIASYNIARDEYITEVKLYFNKIKDSLVEYNNSEKTNEDKTDLLNSLKKIRNKFFTLNEKAVKHFYPHNFFINTKNNTEYLYQLHEILLSFPNIDLNLLDNQDFVNIFQDIFQFILFSFALEIENIADFVEDIVIRFNLLTRPGYFKIICDHIKYDPKFYNYNCGRALAQVNLESKDTDNTRFIIFNTNNDAYPDREILEQYVSRVKYNDLVLDNINYNIPVFKKAFINSYNNVKLPDETKSKHLKLFIEKGLSKLLDSKYKNLDIYFRLKIPELETEDFVLFLRVKKENKIEEYILYIDLSDLYMIKNYAYKSKMFTDNKYSLITFLDNVVVPKFS